MSPIQADLNKLRSLVDDDGWKIDSLEIRFLPQSPTPGDFRPQTTVRLGKDKRELVLQSEDSEFFRFCSALRQSLDEDGKPGFRRFTDLNRYHSELEQLTKDADAKRNEAVRRCMSGGQPPRSAPEPLIIEFLKSRQWGSPAYLQLKHGYFENQALTLLSSRKALEAQESLQKRYPASKVLADRVDRLLSDAFGDGENPVSSYLCFAESASLNLEEIAAKLLAEARQTGDLFRMLATRTGGIRGDLGLPYLVDVYRRYAEWSRPLIKVLSNAVCRVEGNPQPDPSLGLTKRCELIRRSCYADIVESLDPRIRHAASHNAVKYDHSRGMVQFTDVDTNGNRLSELELSYVEVSDKTQAFTQGLIPALLAAFGMRQQALLLMTVLSGEYLSLILLVDNMAD
jgi:hypothetical protein